jgi:hypothetical protein
MPKSRGADCQYCMGKVYRANQKNALFDVTEEAVHNITSVPIETLNITGWRGNPPTHPDLFRFVKLVCDDEARRPKKIRIWMNSCIGSDKKKSEAFIRDLMEVSKGTPLYLLVSASPMHAGLSPSEDENADAENPKVRVHREEIKTIHDAALKIENELAEKQRKEKGTSPNPNNEVGLKHYFLVRSYKPPVGWEGARGQYAEASVKEKNQMIIKKSKTFRKILDDYGIPIDHALLEGRLYTLDELKQIPETAAENEVTIDVDGKYYCGGENMTVFGNVHKQPLSEALKKIGRG